MLQAVSKAAFRVRSAETALGTLREAVRVALTPPYGPVSVEIPIDIQATEIDVPAALAPAEVATPRPDAGEIDVIAADGDTLCFVEVKARRDDEHGPAIAAVGPRKQQRLARCAALYLAIHGVHGRAARFDVVGLEREKGRWRCDLVRGAFEATASFSV